MPWEREIEACRTVARRAGELALSHPAKGVAPEDKSDDSPVTAADRECERLIVSEIPGTTRDPVDMEIVYDGQPITLIDTAGIRRRVASGEGRSGPCSRGRGSRWGRSRRRTG